MVINFFILIFISIFELEKVFESPFDFKEKNFFKNLFLGKGNVEKFSLPYSISIFNKNIAICDGERIFYISKNKILNIDFPFNSFCMDIALNDNLIFASFPQEGIVAFYDLKKKNWEKVPFTFEKPNGLYYDYKNNELYVVDTQSHKIYKGYEKNLIPFITDGLNFPIDLTISKNGRIYITDSFDYEVEVREKNGNFLFSFGKGGNKFGSFQSLRGIAVDEDERVYLSDTQSSWIQVFSKEGKLLYVWSDKKISHPNFLFYEKGILYVPDLFSKLIFLIKINIPEEK